MSTPDDRFWANMPPKVTKALVAHYKVANAADTDSGYVEEFIRGLEVQPYQLKEFHPKRCTRSHTHRTVIGEKPVRRSEFIALKYLRASVKHLQARRVCEGLYSLDMFLRYVPIKHYNLYRRGDKVWRLLEAGAYGYKPQLEP